MRQKKFWYGTKVPRDSGIYWVDFCFYWLRIVAEKHVKHIIFKKRLKNHSRFGDKHTLYGLWVPHERAIYLNPATRSKRGTPVPLGKTLMHELYHVLDPTAPEAYVRDIAEPELWELSTERQRAYLRRYLQKQWIRQYGKNKRRKQRRA